MFRASIPVGQLLAEGYQKKMDESEEKKKQEAKALKVRNIVYSSPRPKLEKNMPS